MQQAIKYDFNEQLAMSQGISESKSVKEIIQNNIPGALYVFQANSKNDKNGTDWWVECSSGKFLSVDVKVRGDDYLKKGFDDLALETFSVVEKSIIGWTRNADKQTDYIVWFWKDTGRWCLVPFKMLCKVFQENWVQWKEIYQCSLQETTKNGCALYHSECVFVPRREVWKKIYLNSMGTL